LAVRAVDFLHVFLALYLVAIEQHTDQQVLLLVEECAGDCFPADAPIAHVVPVADPRDLRIVELEPRVELLRVKVSPVVPSIVDDHATEDIAHALACLGRRRHLVKVVECDLGNEQVENFADRGPVVIHVNVWVLQP